MSGLASAHGYSGAAVGSALLAGGLSLCVPTALGGGESH